MVDGYASVELGGVDQNPAGAVGYSREAVASPNGLGARRSGNNVLELLNCARLLNSRCLEGEVLRPIL